MMAGRRIRVAIVEDDGPLRASLEELIAEAPDLLLTGSFRDCESAIPALVGAPADVVLMDIQLPGISGLEGIQRLREQLPALDVVVLTIHEKDETVFRALRAGACGYLVKSDSIDRLAPAIREAHDGGAPMSTHIARRIVASFQTVPRTPSPLTAREQEVLEELCEGKSYRMIGESLHISEETVRRHLKSIYRKLEVHSKSHAVAKALQDRLVDRD